MVLSILPPLVNVEDKFIRAPGHERTAEVLSLGEKSYNVVVVLDLLDQTASAKLTASWGIDHMQLGKVDGKWKIRHVMWQSHPPTQD